MFSLETKLGHYIMIFTPSWPPKWQKIGSAKKYTYKCTYKYFKIKTKKLSYLLPASRGSLTFTPS